MGLIGGWRGRRRERKSDVDKAYLASENVASP